MSKSEMDLTRIKSLVDELMHCRSAAETCSQNREALPPRANRPELWLCELQDSGDTITPIAAVTGDVRGALAGAYQRQLRQLEDELRRLTSGGADEG